MTKARDLSQTPNASLGFKNRIINGAMMIDQRNAGASVTPADSIYTIDRWKYFSTQSSKITVQQSSTAPVGFTNSMLITSTSAYSVTTNDYFLMNQLIEGYNFADLGWGTADAQPVTLSFRVRSSLTGTFGGYVANGDLNRSYSFSFTISAANTWETKTITIVGDTTGTWNTTNGKGLYLGFSLGAGSGKSTTPGSWGSTWYPSATGATSVVGTSGATFYITGVQLEKGSTATSFDYRPYGTELALCYRYYEVIGYRMQGGGNYTTGTWVVTKRASPTLTLSGTGTIAVTSSTPTSAFVLTAYGSSSYDAIVTGSSEL